MMWIRSFFVFSILTIFTLMSVQPGRSHSDSARHAVRGFHGIAHALADGLDHNLVQHVDRTKTILFTSLVDLDDLNASSTFGRLLGEQIASRMSQLGYRIVELKLRQGSMIISENAGEMVLSRNLREVRSSHDAQGIIVGTYTVLSDSIIVTVKLLSTLDGSILSTQDATLRKTSELHELVAKNPTIFQPQRSQPSEQSTQPAPEGPLARGTILLDPKNSLAARLIQTRLAELNYYTDRIDGLWGKNSRAALNRFKSARQLASPTAWDLSTQRELFQGTGQ
ncbi:hypothetical protein SAMN05660653_01011 [Desulfonatronum thiosulfatophilum]|uniref:FlgO domain-containing protein n=1 Tax=Desulfonatronum thiosulfatophilum TaxID=617002 RepID=A0A1G6BKK7_9BACT|nr:FlgO family outer membrane protein [Desulfonatronum thiosulfatophilum]SDB21118.1 hypothetical protein SAMN05660653_01011 [Desulfonatronum thiosulfatophilum]